jgi:zinc finger protein
MKTTQTEYHIEHFGSVLFSVAECQKCGYRHNDLISITKKEPVVLTAKINSLEDLNIRVIKSGTASVSIPEFKATITPGPYSEGYITNVDGMLDRIEDALTFMLSSAKGASAKKGERLLKRIHAAKEGKPRFTLVIKDPLGNSGLVSSDPSKVKRRRLTKGELLAVKFGQYTVLENAQQK